jgi:hypothetical protein
VNKQRLKASLDLIQALLSCPRGEEWILLRQNEGLVNGELVEVMEQVANHLAIEGKIRAAKYLYNWAGKLHHILTENVPLNQKNDDQTSAYLELIEALLNCPEGAEESILAAHPDLIGPKLVQVMKQVANQIAAEGNEEAANFLNKLATNLNQTWLKQHEFQPALKKEIAPDPWLEEIPSADSSVTETQLTGGDTPTVEIPEKPTLTSPQPPRESEQQLTQQFQAITQVLVRLETTLASRVPPSNPLWYMDILEKAAAANWILTTDEVEHLIGIRPQCHHDETLYHRGSWVFIKAGKIGAQTGWRVEKK